MSLLAVLARDGLGDAPLMELWCLIDWSPIETELEPLRQDLGRKGGPTPWPPAPMFRATLLQGWHALSFNELAQAFRVRLDFQLFAGFEPGFPVPSASSFCRARQRLERGGRRARCLDLVSIQLEAANVKVIPAEGAIRDIRLEKSHRGTDGD